MTFHIITTENGVHAPQYGNRLAYWRGGRSTSIIVTPKPDPGILPLGLGIGSLFPDQPTLSGEKALTRVFFGPLTYTDANQTRIDTDGGYIADGRFHALYPDFQGNIRAVACGGEIRQVNHYYPYGLPFAEGIKPDAQPYKYGAKELITDANLDLYDFHARFYDPAVPSWSRIDPLCEKKPYISPSSYCRANPIHWIDPSGCDEYIINRNGQIVSHTEQTGDHIIYSMDSYGEVRLTFETVIPKESLGVVKTETSNDITYTLIQINGKEIGMELFLNLVFNSDAEWSIGIDDQSENCTLTSGYDDDSEPGFTEFMVNNLSQVQKITTHIHSHPSSSELPSGLENRRTGDIGFANYFTKLINNSQVRFFIYSNGKNKFVNYGPNSKREDYPENAQ